MPVDPQTRDLIEEAGQFIAVMDDMPKVQAIMERLVARVVALEATERWECLNDPACAPMLNHETIFGHSVRCAEAEAKFKAGLVSGR